MNLYSRIIGSGPPVLVLHGLLGMSDNWLTIGRGLANHGLCVHLLDLRNHG
ncbi:MAG: alpha/beta fold hydrolase, partial [Desulfofustis sp.]|nr:alpha/beta fold hydrolase [Desulfofustis sp.]